MNLTLGFIAFFISIVIPGILFRRFFFYGEFSKQFNTKDPVLHSIFFSIVPGIVIQLICFITYYSALGFDTSFFDVFTIFRDITSDGTSETQNATKNFINNDIITFFIYTIFVFCSATFLGFITSRFIRAGKLDMKYKLFRFKNQWYYIFSGEVLNMKKFKEAHRVSLKNNKKFEQDVSMTFADILVSVSEDNDRKELYSGFVVDYDLMSEDITQLDKIYLIDTHRYKKKEKLYNEDGKEIKEKIKGYTISRNRIKVPGDIFVLSAKNIVNINLTYVPSLRKKAEKELKKVEKEQSKQKKYRILRQTYFFVFILIILLHLFYKIIPFSDNFLSNYFTNTNFWGKLITIILLNQLISLPIPLGIKDNKIFYDRSKWFKRICLIFIWGAIFCYFVLDNLI